MISACLFVESPASSKDGGDEKSVGTAALRDSIKINGDGYWSRSVTSFSNRDEVN
jgi:hypothetical protein